MTRNATQVIADLARPFSIYALAIASSAAIGKMGWSIGDAIASGKADGYQAAALAGVVLAGASAIYIGKSFENKWQANANAAVETARVQASPPAPPAGSATITAGADVRVDATVTDTNDGRLPPGERVNP